MGIFDKFKKKTVNGNSNGFDSVQINTGDTPLSILNKMPESEGVISLKKSVISLDKSIISLEKKSGMDLSHLKAKVAVVMDYSGSMSSMYRNGSVQKVLTRLMPLALRFDDNGEMEVWIFDDSYHRIDSMDLSNFDTYVDREIRSKGYHMGCTSYAPVLKDVLHKYFVEEKSTSDIPTFVVFITDGANDDKRETDKTIVESSKNNIFIQFVGIGHESFDYLQKLDDLNGRVVDNTGFIKVDDLERLSDEELFNKLLEQYPDWLRDKASKGI